MQSFIQKPGKPVTVQAVQYVAPTADEPGNIDEIQASGASVRPQSPWNPAAGQHSIIVDVPAGATKLLTDADILVVYPNGTTDVMTVDEFKAAFDAVPDAPKS